MLFRWMLLLLVGTTLAALDVVLPDQPTEGEKLAARELTLFAGEKVVVYSESQAPGLNGGIYLGNTRMAQSQNLRAKDFGLEECILQSVGPNLIITGGAERGTLYGAYEFLERFRGVRFLAPNRTMLGQKLFPKNIKLRVRPAFDIRYFVSGSLPHDMAEFMRFQTRNRHNAAYMQPGSGTPFVYGSPGMCHTFHALSKDFPKDKIEYFSLDASGRRLRSVDGGGPGQLCISHPEVRKLVAAKLLDFVRLDREKAQKNNRISPTIYVLAGNDNNQYCHCDNCMNFTKKGGNYTDAQLDFVNAVAAELKKHHPELYLMTMAYTYTMEPPKFVRPADNVLIQIANLGREFTNGVSEVLLPVSAGQNENFRRIFDSWTRISKQIAVWDYYVLYCKPIHYPYLNTHRLVEDMRYFRANKVRTMLTESEYPESSFHALRHYMALRLMHNPDSEREALLSDYFRGVYGPASKPMRQYLDLVEKSVRNEPGLIGLKMPGEITYLTPSFFRQANRLLDQAEQAAGSDKQILTAIRLERLPVDAAQIYLKKFDHDREKVLTRYEGNLRLLPERYKDKGLKEKVGRQIASLRLEVSPLAQFEGKNTVDFLWPDFTARPGVGINLVEDASAAGGKALHIGKTNQAKLHQMPLKFGLYNVTTKEFGPAQALNKLPADGKYHLYKIGRFNLMPGSIFHIPWAWMVQQRLDKAYPGTPDHYCDVYVSLKVTGPAYGAPGEDAIWIDRIIVDRTGR